MACPYFHAVKPRNQTGDSRSPMLPLGDAWDGVCRANPEVPWQPDEITLLSHCNLGYARGCCARFPAGDGPDAARFTIAANSTETVRIYYVLERDHRPWAHGPLEYSRSSDSFTEETAGEATLALARAYAASYLRRISEASAR
ncbi:MAG TPA: hypothetical protein VMB03_21775 [Bryobacteraceae bacterium]|nr:hypothetical protein [Bryobacteraceae bacterium]